MLEADRVELFLGYWTRHDRGRRTRSGQSDGEFQRIERAVRAGDAWVTGSILVSRRKLDQRKRIIESRIGLARVIDNFDGSVPHGGD